MDTDGFCPLNVNSLLIITQPPTNNSPAIIGVYQCSSVYPAGSRFASTLFPT